MYNNENSKPLLEYLKALRDQYNWELVYKCAEADVNLKRGAILVLDILMSLPEKVKNRDEYERNNKESLREIHKMLDEGMRGNN